MYSLPASCLVYVHDRCCKSQSRWGPITGDFFVPGARLLDPRFACTGDDAVPAQIMCCGLLLGPRT